MGMADDGRPLDDSGELKMMSVSQAVAKRRSIRKFLPERTVSLSLISSLIQKATRAASGGNTQPWHLYVVTGDKKAQLSDAVFKEMAGGNAGDEPEYNIYPLEQPASYLDRRRRVAKEMYRLMGIKKSDQASRIEAMKRNYLFFDAPIGIIITIDRCADRNGWGHTGMLLQTLSLLALEEGLATCFLESWSIYNKVVYENLNIPKDQIVWCGMALGYEDKNATVNSLVTEREPVDNIAKFFGFDSKL